MGVIFSVFIRDRRNGGMIKHPLPSSDERTVCLHHNAILLTIIYNLSLLKERMELPNEGVRAGGHSGWLRNRADGFTWI